MIQIEKQTLRFLSDLRKNNEREWFQAHKPRYAAAQQNLLAWVDALIAEMNKHDQLQTASGKESLYRIYNDVRFAADKTPYKPRFAGRLKRQQPWLRGGYYFWITPGASRVGCGFSYPNPADLKRIRKDIDYNERAWRGILKNKKLTRTFGDMQGEHVRTAPKGYRSDHPAIDLLRHKQFWFEHAFTDAEVVAPGFLKQVSSTYRAIRPFFDYMSDILATDANGEMMKR